jgi:hypothetical protein
LFGNLFGRRQHDIAIPDLPVISLEHERAGAALIAIERCACDAWYLFIVDDGDPVETGTVMAGGMAVVFDGQLGAAVVEVRDSHPFARALENVIETAQLEGRQIFAIGIARAVLNGARHADQSFNTAVVRCYLFIGDGPVIAGSVERGGFEVDLAEAGGGAAPEVGLAAGRFAARPGPAAAWRDGVGDVVLEEVESDLMLAIALALLARLRIAEAAILQFVAVSMIAVVFIGVEPLPGIECEHVEPRFAEELDSRAAAGARADHNNVVNFSALLHGRHISFQFSVSVFSG